MISLILALSLGGGGCSSQLPKASDSATSKQSDRDGEPRAKPKDDSAKPGSVYGSGEEGADKIVGSEGTGKVPPATSNETPDAPQPVTGSPTNSQKLEEGQILPNGSYRVQNFYTKKCLVVHQQKLDVGAPIVQGGCTDPSAIFSVSFVDHQFYMFNNKLTQRALQIRNSLASSEALIEQGDYRARDHQNWRLDRQGDGTYLIKPALNNSLCMDVAFGSKDDNAAIQLWKQCDALGEKWILLEVD